MSTNKFISTDEAVYRLIHHKGYRELFLARAFSKMNLSESTLMDLETIDQEQLSASANRIAKKLLSGSHQGSHGLESIFEETFTAWKIQTKKENLNLIFDFMESDSFAKYHELSFVGKGYCIEQAFYEFIKKAIWNDGNPLEGIARNEFLISLFKTLSKAERPNFQLDARYIKKNDASLYSVQLYRHRLIGNRIEQKPHFVLYAATGGQLLSGEITPFIADILYDEKESPFKKMGEIIKRHNVSVRAFFSTCNQLIRMGVIPQSR